MKLTTPFYLGPRFRKHEVMCSSVPLVSSWRMKEQNLISFTPVQYLILRVCNVHNITAPSHIVFSCITLTPWCRVLLEKLTGLQLVKKFPTFHGTQRFITALTSIRHISLSWASPIQSIYPHPTSWRSVLILSTHLRLGLPSCLLPSGFPSKSKHLYLFYMFHVTCFNLTLKSFKKTNFKLYGLTSRN